MPLRHVLALDQSTRRIGWAIGRHDMLAPLTGVYALPAVGARHGVLMGLVRDWLDTPIKTYHVTKVAFETPFSGFDAQNYALVNKMLGVVELVCDDHEIKCVEAMPVQWRKHFIGCGQAPRTIPKPKRRAWLKEQAMRACAARRWDVKTDDEADACGILSYVLALAAEQAKQG